MKVLGSRVYLLMPTLPERKVEISAELSKSIQKEMAEKLDKLEVYAVSESTKDIKVGDTVKVDPSCLAKAVILKIENKDILVVMNYEIMHIW